MKTLAHIRYSSNLAFIDTFFNLTLVFAFLFLISFLLIRPPADHKPAVEMKAEFMLTMTWPTGSLDDQDLWLLLPNGQWVGYPNKDIGIASLDRDDRGAAGNIFVDTAGEEKLIEEHREIITIRAIMPGRYIVNVHTFSVVSTFGQFKSKVQLPYTVRLQFMKINPRVQELKTKEVMMTHLNDQKTFFAFTINEEGSVFFEDDVDVPFVQTNIVRRL